MPPTAPPTPESRVGKGPRLDESRIPRLVAGAQAGAVEDFGALVRLFHPRIYNFHLRRCRRPADAEDLTQDTFVRAWERLDRYRDAWPFATWLFTIANRLGINHLRRQRLGSLVLARKAAEVSPRPAPPDTCATREQLDDLWLRAETELSLDQRTGLWLRHAEGLTIDQIARVLGKLPVATRVMLHRARRKLAAHPSPPRSGTGSRRLAAPETPAPRLVEGLTS